MEPEFPSVDAAAVTVDPCDGDSALRSRRRLNYRSPALVIEGKQHRADRENGDDDDNEWWNAEFALPGFLFGRLAEFNDVVAFQLCAPQDTADAPADQIELRRSSASQGRQDNGLRSHSRFQGLFCSFRAAC